MSDGPEISGQALPAGTQLEEFVIERVLGTGGFGITYLAKDTTLDRQVVIKENLPVQFCYRDTHSLTVAPRHTVSEDAENFAWSLENFEREAATLGSLDHPGIVRVLRSFEAFGTAYFVMPFVEGLAFDELIESRQAKGTPFSEEELTGLLKYVLEALGYLHERGIYHRDIKPGNILITMEGEPVLIDFGSARQRLSERSMTVVESAGYTPFEQLQSRGNVGPWSDLYALGGTVCKALTGEAPPKAMDRMRDDPHSALAGRVELQQKYSQEFLRSIDQALAVEEPERWQDAGEWLGAMETPAGSARAALGREAGTEYSADEPADVRAVEEREFEIADGVKVRMCWIPGGEFEMGSPAGELGREDDEGQRRIRITRGFWLGKYEVMQTEWEAVMGSNPSKFTGTKLPVENVSWLDICGDEERNAGFLGKANGKALSGWGYDLPTEAEWEYGCRAGTQAALNSGKKLTSTKGECRNLEEVGWYSGNSGNWTHEVGGKKANAWGVHDMHGNVWEWCRDRYGGYGSGLGVDPVGPAGGTARVVRGGSLGDFPGYCRSASRYWDLPVLRYNYLGFRLVLRPSP